LEIAGYCAKRSSREQSRDAVERVFDDAVGKSAITEAKAIQNQVGDDVFSKNLDGEICIIMAEAAGPIDGKVARDYLSKALTAVPPLTGLRKSHALSLRAYVKNLLGDKEGSRRDRDQAKTIVAEEERELRTEIGIAFENVNDFDPNRRPDLASRREACEFQNNLLKDL
jgi:hypothetical protein